jgi:homoserine dehydrogenase
VAFDIIQFGLGGVGRALVRQVLDLGDRVPGLRYRALADRSGIAWNGEGFAAAALRAVLATKDAGGSLRTWWEAEQRGGEFAPGVPDLDTLDLAYHTGMAEAVVVDVTAERGNYPALLLAREAGLNVVLCNKWPLAVNQAEYDALLTTGTGRLRYETTVGAALPVIGTLDNLLATGDSVSRIDAAISGTLGFVMTAIQTGQPFSAALRAAQAAGYTEPDPRDDLGGTDARRKALILARKLGWRGDMPDVQVESLVPAGLESVSLDAFWAELPARDAAWAARVAEAAGRGEVLRFLATVQPTGASVGVYAVPQASLAGSLAGTESLFVFHTRRYGDQPLAVRGRGAGTDVTASGVLADILALGPGASA